MALHDYVRIKTHYNCGNVERGQGLVACIEEFEARIEGTPTMDYLVEEAAKSIPTRVTDERQVYGRYDVYPAFDSFHPHGIGPRIPYGNRLVDEDRGVAAFVLLGESEGGIKEGIYVLRRDGEKLRGKLIAFNRRCARDVHTFRHQILGIEEGILTYVTGFAMGKEVARQDEKRFFDLNALEGRTVLYDSSPRVYVPQFACN